MAKQQLVTKESLAQMIKDSSFEKCQHIIGRALVVLLNNQTRSEQQSATTDQSNGVGFASCDARGGTLTAQSYRKNKSLLSWQVDQWTRMQNGYPRICKYVKQLNEAAIAKAANETARLI